MFRVLAAAALLLAASPASAGPTVQEGGPPDGIVWHVLDQINAFYFDIDDPTNRPPLVTEVPEGVLTPVDINADGRTDWLISWPEEVAFCGTGGCDRTLYVSGAPVPGAEDQATGFSRAFDRQALDFSIGEVAGEIRIEARVHHGLCSDDRTDCLFAWAWDEPARRLVQRPSSDGRTVIEGAGTPPVDDDDPTTAWLPSELAALLEASKVVCPASFEATGYEVLRADVQSIPDVNDDGRPDWLAALPAPCVSGSVHKPPEVWVSAEGDSVALAWQAATGDAELDVGHDPAVLVWKTGCADGDDCERRTLNWDADSRTLRP
jgi:hypothetical protein